MVLFDMKKGFQYTLKALLSRLDTSIM